jgi:hypothetical protein
MRLLTLLIYFTMKNIHFLLFTFPLLLLFSSACQQEEPVGPDALDTPASVGLMMPGLTSAGVDINGYMFVLSQNLNPRYDGFSYAFNGAVHEEVKGLSPRLFGGEMKINDQVLEFLPDRENVYGHTYLGGEFKNEVRPAFGRTSVFSLAGNAAEGITGFIDSLHVPAVLEVEMSPKAQGGVEKGVEITFTWEPDNETEQMVAFFFYSGEYNQITVGPEMPREDIIESVLIDDDGSYTFEADGWLGQVPPGAIFKIGLARGNFTLVPVGERHYAIGGGTMVQAAVHYLK